MSSQLVNPFHELEIEELNEFMREVLGIEKGLDSVDQLQQPDVAGRFKITSLDQVTWAMRKLGALKAKKANINELAKQEAARIEVWKERQLKGMEQSAAFFENLLSDYMLDKRAIDPKFKSESTPYGRITFTKQPAEWQYKDEEATANYLMSISDEAGNYPFKEHAKVAATIANKTNFKKAMEIKNNVFIELAAVDSGDSDMIVDYATVDVETGVIKGMDYAVKGVDVVSLETGEIVPNVIYKEAVAVVYGVYVIPGVDVVIRPEKIEVKAEA